jgi:hypothetical protein
MINIKIDTDNQAFDDENEGNYSYEVARILHKLAERFEQGERPDFSSDTNGNLVCEIEYQD